MSRNHSFSSEKIAIVGRSGRGKSTFQRQLVRAWPAEFKFIFDHKGEFSALLPAHLCRTPDECDAALSQTKSVCFKPQGLPRDHFAEWCETVFAACQKLPGRKLFVFDECGLLVPKHPAKYEQHAIRSIAETGREWGIDMLFAAQQPTQICTELRAQVSKWVCFQLSAKAAEPLIAECEFEPSYVTRLGKGQFIAYDAESSEFSRGQSKPDQ
jgi:energy-coupling factor transporter ATP-binding protein EcfA2